MKYIKRILLIFFAAILIFFAAGSPVVSQDDDSSEVLTDYYEENIQEESHKTSEKGIIEKVNSKVNSFAWGPIMLLLLVGTGVYFTISTGVFQFAKFPHIMKNTIGKLFIKKEKTTLVKGAITPFQALTTAMAGTMGIGNIAGVAGAIILGGPGAIFWMWVSAVFGMMTKFAEVVLSVRFRERDINGDWVGGPMYYIKNGLGKKYLPLGALFAFLGSICAFGIGNMTQVNTIAGSFVSAFSSLKAVDIEGTGTETLIRVITGVSLAILTALVLLGGVKRIGKVTEKLIPIMSIFYIAGSLIIVTANIEKIGSVFESIFLYAFYPKAILGGVGGYVLFNTIKRGVSRGVFSNEAGLGSAPIVHASTSEKDPVKQGLYGIFEVFADTIVFCTLTALVILLSGVVVPFGDSSFAGQTLTANAFATVFGSKISSVFVAISILFFAYATVLSWSYYGTTCFSYLTKEKGIKLYQIVFVLFIIIGATMNLSLAWDIADTLNGLMAIPNLIAVLGLSGVVIKLVKEYKMKL